MLSRILWRDDEPGNNTEPMVWPSAPGDELPTGTGVHAPRPAAHAAGHEAEEVARLKQRVSELEALMEKRVRETRQSAHKEGEAAGRKQAEAEVQAVLQRLGAAIQETAGLRARIRLESEVDLVKLAVAIARRILNRQLSVDPEAIAGIVKAGFDKLKRQEVLRVRVHPAHQAAVRGMMPPGSPVEVLADAALEPGGVVFETSRGDLEASIDSQLGEIERGLTDRLSVRHG